MDEIFEIKGQHVFTLERAKLVLPLIRQITKTANDRLQNYIRILDQTPISMQKERSELEESMSLLVKLWQEKIKKIGGHPVGVWLIDFDSGDGFFCWKYPETDITHWHKYTDGFSGRQSVIERHKQQSNEPDLLA